MLCITSYHVLPYLALFTSLAIYTYKPNATLSRRLKLLCMICYTLLKAVLQNIQLVCQTTTALRDMHLPNAQIFGPEANTSYYIRNQYRVYRGVASRL